MKAAEGPVHQAVAPFTATTEPAIQRPGAGPRPRPRHAADRGQRRSGRTHGPTQHHPRRLRNDEGTPEQIADAISHDDPGDVKAINDFSRAKANQRPQLIQVLLRQTWLAPFDRRAVTRIVNGAGDLEALDEATVAELRKCHERGYDLHDLSRYDNLVLDFRSEVKKSALDNLGKNIELITAEATRLGVSGDAGKAATKEQTEAIEEQQRLAQQIDDAKRMMSATRKIVVAHHGPLEQTTAPIGSPITFDPTSSPAPPGVAVVTASNPAAHEAPWQVVYDQYTAMAKAIASVLNKNPALYALTSLTEDAPDEKPKGGKDPHLNFGQQRIAGFDSLGAEAARKKVRAALTDVWNNARLTMAKVMGGQLSPLQMDTLVARFHAGDHGKRWSSSYVKFATGAAVAEESSSFDKTMAEIGLALLLASLVIGTAGGAAPVLGAVIAAANVGTAAAGAAIATLNAEDLKRASQSTVSDENAIVSPEKAGRAELDAIMYQFAAIAAIAGEGVGVLLSSTSSAVMNLGAVSKMSRADQVTAIVDALEAMEPGQVALRTGLPPEDMLAIVAPRAKSDPAAAAATTKLQSFLNRFSGPLIGPTSGKSLDSLLRQAKMTIRQYWNHVQGLGLRQVDSVTLHVGYGDAELEYVRLIEDTPAREAGIYRNSSTGEHAVVQGSGDWKGGEVSHLDGLPEANNQHWILVEHYHPERNFAVQFPSGGVDAAGNGTGDFAVLLYDHGETNVTGVLQGQQSTVIHSRIEARIRFRDPKTGDYHFTTYGYDPAAGPIGSFFVRAETESGAVVDYSFKDIAGIPGARADYERHMAGLTPGQPVVKATP